MKFPVLHHKTLHRESLAVASMSKIAKNLFCSGLDFLLEHHRFPTHRGKA